MSQEKPLELQFNGPFSFLPGNQWLFDNENMRKGGVYIWTIKPDSSNKQYLLYVGQSYDILLRHSTHLRGILSLDYSIYKLNDKIPCWKRNLLDKKYKGNYQINREQLEKYASPKMNENVINYLRMIEVFFVVLEGFHREEREQIESMIGHYFKDNHHKDTEEERFYLKDVQLPNKTKKYCKPIKLIFSSNGKIVGLDSETVISI